jgi:hypothetical protein
MKKIWWLVILFLVAMESCMPLHSKVTKPVVFRDVSDPGEWAIGDKLAYLVVTDKNWSTYYSSPPKGSDFATCIYVIASLGVRPNPGYRIRILRIQQERDVIRIIVELMEPDPKKVYPQVLVHPIAVAEVPKANLQKFDLLNFVFTDQKGRQISTVKIEI